MVELAVLHEVVRDASGRAVDYRIVDCNAAFTRVTGIPPERAIGQLASRVYGTEPAPYLDIYARVAETGEPEHFVTYFAPMEKHFGISVVSPRRGWFATVASDITEQKKVAESLRESEAVLRSFFDSPGIMRGIVELVEDDILHVSDNPLSAKFFGRTTEAIRGQRATAMGVSSETVQMWTEKYQESRSTGRPVTFEYPDATGGDARWLSATVSYLGRAPSGNERFAYAVMDVTDRRKGEQALAAEKERLAVTLRSIGDAVIATDDAARITVFSKVAEELTGWRCEEALGRAMDEVFRIVNEDTRLPVTDPVERVLREGAVVGLANHTALVARAGKVTPIEDCAAPIRDTNGNIEGVVLVFRDVTEHRRMETTARRHQRALLTLSQCNEALVRASDEQGLLDAICRIIVGIGGYRMAWVGFAEHDERRTVRPVARAGHDEGYLASLDIVWADAAQGGSPSGRAIRTGTPVIEKDIASDRDSAPWRAAAVERGYRAAAACPLTAEGATFGVLAIYAPDAGAFDDDEVKLLVELANDLAFGIAAFRSRAERDTMTAQLMQADRLVVAGTLAAGVVHEINNPLTYVIGALGFLEGELRLAEKELPAGRLAEAHDALGEAREGAERVKHVVRDLKTFSRVDEKRTGRVDLHHVLDSSLNMAFNEIKYRARIVKDYGPVPPVRANEARVGQVFLNLLVNAAHAIREGRVEENEIRVVTRTDDAGRAIVEVRDTGTGISPENLGRIFDPFFTTKPVGVGTGLGLSICRNIVSALRGEITAESSVGQGAIVRVVLPPAPSATDDEALPPPPHVKKGRRGRVLVVDDEAAVGRAVRRVLVAEHDVDVVTGAREALRRIAGGERFDVIVCDLMMPEMSGMDLHAELTMVAPDQAERMIMLTGGAFTARASQFLDTVPNPRVEKPFDAANLRALVRNTVG